MAAGTIYQQVKGWQVYEHPENTNSNTKKHIHIKKGKYSYAQNEDGSPHDGSTGSPPKSVKEYLKKSGWDWDQKAQSWENKNNPQLLHYCTPDALEHGECTCSSYYIWDHNVFGPIIEGPGLPMPAPAPGYGFAFVY